MRTFWSKKFAIQNFKGKIGYTAGAGANCLRISLIDS